jgi:hypothetical protein
VHTQLMEMLSVGEQFTLPILQHTILFSGFKMIQGEKMAVVIFYTSCAPAAAVSGLTLQLPTAVAQCALLDCAASFAPPIVSAYDSSVACTHFALGITFKVVFQIPTLYFCDTPLTLPLMVTRSAGSNVTGRLVLAPENFTFAAYTTGTTLELIVSAKPSLNATFGSKMMHLTAEFAGKEYVTEKYVSLDTTPLLAPKNLASGSWIGPKCGGALRLVWAAALDAVPGDETPSCGVLGYTVYRKGKYVAYTSFTSFFDYTVSNVVFVELWKSYVRFNDTIEASDRVGFASTRSAPLDVCVHVFRCRNCCMRVRNRRARHHK